MAGSLDAREAARRASAGATQRRLRLVLLALGGLLCAWLFAAAGNPQSSGFQRALLLGNAVVLTIHLVFWQIELINKLDRLPKALRGYAALVALIGSPMVIYPLGLFTLVFVALFGSGIGAAALGVAGTVMLLPIAAIVLIGVLFALHGWAQKR